MKKLVLRNIFLNNRAEQYPDDIWDQFVIPIHFHTLDMRDDKKSVVILGGRGSGKTMFMKYFCHQTAFSPDRKEISDNELKNIGIYWKPDIKFCRFLDKDWFNEQEKENIFNHYLALNILYDYSKAIKSISSAAMSKGKINILSHPIPDSIKPYFNDSTLYIGDLEKFVEEDITKLDLWITNDTIDKPKFITFSSIVERISESLSESDPRLQDIFFRIFVDEFENLKPAQQRQINDFIRAPGKRFSINIARRRHSDIVKETSGFEKIVDIHDYRTIDLQSYFHEAHAGRANFNLFAAEILIFRSMQSGIELNNFDIDLSILKDENKLEDRHAPEYQSKIKSLAKEILPQLSVNQISAYILDDKALLNRWKKQLKTGLKYHNSTLQDSEFLRKDHSEDSLVSAALVNRDSDRFNPDNVCSELLKLESDNDKSLFSGDGGWTMNNIYGELFYLYMGIRSKTNPLYAGFDRFCVLARGNLRFFQELCHQSFITFESENASHSIRKFEDLIISTHIQALAAGLTADKLLSEIEHLGTSGPNLKLLINRLGKIFELSHKRLAQSEPEINHFSISFDSTSEKDRKKINDLLNEAKTWSVVYAKRDTKNKGSLDSETEDIIPNPIYSPYFGISYRRKRKITISAREFLSIVEGSEDSFRSLIYKYASKWNVEIDDSEQPDLFPI